MSYMSDKAKYEARALVVKAMAHPTRLFIVEELARKERCVCDLTDMIGSDISTVSKHLSVLKNAGIVGNRKEGTQIIYHLKMPCVLGFFNCVESVIRSTAREQLTLVKVDGRS